jgi:hypothetical protein
MKLRRSGAWIAVSTLIAAAIAAGVVNVGGPPTIQVPPAITGTFITGNTASCSNGTWTGTPTSYARQWKRNNTSIGGATGTDYVLLVADENQNLKCTVTATNSSGSNAADSNTIISTASGGGGGTCDLNATTANFAAQVSASTNGQTICLATGNYGTFTGTNKSITIRKADGAAPTMAVDFGSGDTGFTLDGMGGMSGEMRGTGVSNITIKNSSFSGPLVIDSVENSGIVLDGNTHNNQSRNANCTDTPARLHLSYGSSVQSGVSVRNSSFIGGDRDGIQTGAPMTIGPNNVFSGIREDTGDSDCQHADPLQGIGAPGLVIDGNIVSDSADGFVNFPGDSEDWVVTDNACFDLDRNACIVLYSDDGSIVEHNTAGPGMSSLEINLSGGQNATVGTVFRNNVGPLDAGNGATVATNTNNLFVGASSPNINGSPIFVGGSNPTTWAGFKLAGGSPGKNAATSGIDVGIR